MRKWVTTLLTIAAVVAAGAVTALAPAAAATHRVSHSPAAMRKQLAALVARGATDAQIRQATGLRRVSTTGRAPMSTNSAVTLSTPGIYYDSQAHYYYVTATWNFTKSPPDGGEQKGQDGFGVSFSRQINNMGGSLFVCAKNGSTTTNICEYADNYASNNAYGAGWTFSNFVPLTGGFFAAGHGSMVFAFKLLSSGCLQTFTQYAHSWSSTSVTGVSVGKWSVGVSWRSSGHQWTKASAAGKLGC